MLESNGGVLLRLEISVLLREPAYLRLKSVYLGLELLVSGLQLFLERALLVYYDAAARAAVAILAGAYHVQIIQLSFMVFLHKFVDILQSKLLVFFLWNVIEQRE